MALKTHVAFSIPGNQNLAEVVIAHFSTLGYRLADESGVIALPPGDVRYLAEMALGRQAKQPDGFERLRNGERQSDRVGITSKIKEAADAENAARLAARKKS